VGVQVKMSEEESPRKPKKVKARTESAASSSESTVLKTTTDGHKERTVGEIVVKSDFADESATEQADIILSRFNEGVEKSAFTLNPALGRALPRCDVTYFALGHRNQVAELMDPKGQRYATVYTADPTQTIKSLGVVLKTAHYFGAFGKHVLNVPAGHYALAFSKNRPVIYGEGPHVIIDPTFQFNETTGFVNQQEPYIHHSTIHILRVPAGRVAKVWVGTQPHLFESRRAPYVVVDAQFKLVSPEGSKKAGLFLPAGEPFIEHGSIKRIIPHTGEVAITYNNGILTVIPTPKDGKPVIIDSPTHHFDGFISTALQTCLFPSKETKQQAIMDNSAATSDEVNLKIFQTRDSLRVGVVLVVAFKIVDPECAITKLGKEGIIPHIENVSFADMGKAIQLSTLQEVMYFTQNRPKTPAPGTVDDQLQTIQDRVRNHLARDLADYGIELARLQIETMKVLDTEIAKKLAGQSVTSAEFTTKQATLVKEYDIKTTEARLKAETDNIALSQANQARIAEAQAKFQAAQREADALLIAAEAQRRASELQGELFEQYPELLELELLKIKSHALRTANIFVTPKGEAGSAINSPLLYMPRVQQTPAALAHPTKEEAVHLQHKADKKAAKKASEDF
jgi:regulator of protease activity HflC (stomatin/prohibitin superfamily)